MDISVREMRSMDEALKVKLDGSFTVDSMLNLKVNDGKIEYTITELPPYRKSYEETPGDEYKQYFGNPDRAVYAAYAGETMMGQILLKKHWNKYAFVDLLRVDKSYRGNGTGRQLIEQAKCWAKAGGMAGLMLETQNINVRACKFYESCGFVIGGFDYFLYKGLHPKTEEAAVYWYLIFE